MNDQNSDWIRPDDFVSEVVGKIGRTRQEVREMIAKAVDHFGFSVAVSDGEGNAVPLMGHKFRGGRHWAEAQFIDANEIRRLLENECGVAFDCPGGGTDEAPLTAAAESECVKRLINEMRASPQAGTKTKEAWHTQLKKELPGLSDRAFARAWNKAIKETGANWAKAGAKKRFHS